MVNIAPKHRKAYAIGCRNVILTLLFASEHPLAVSALQNRQILVGISGGIAAYKSAELVRELSRAGACVRVVMTRAATEFITPLTLQALSGNPVHLDLLDTEAEAAMGHIELARWADAIIVAPASANFIARLSQGRADDLLTAVCLASASPLALAPAMNQQMWRSDATRNNCEQLAGRGVQLFGPAEGEQACGDVGPGRMLEPGILAHKLEQLFDSGLLAGKKVVITAGPTREALDPVRYISNHSSGKMGYALAQAAIDAGADTTLVSGPVNISPPARATCINVNSAQEMYTQALALVQNCDIFVAAAAVADYRPDQVAENKIKKGDSESMTLTLIKNPDIVADVAAQQQCFVVGFAAETHEVDKYARKKLVDKQLNMIIANDVSDPSIGFNSDNNAVNVYWDNEKTSFGPVSKSVLAKQLIELIAQRS